MRLLKIVQYRQYHSLRGKKREKNILKFISLRCILPINIAIIYRDILPNQYLGTV